MHPSPDQPDLASVARNKPPSRLALGLALLLVCVNLRPMLSGVGPVLDSIQNALGLSATAAGVLLTLPLLCFGVFAPVVPYLLRRFTPERLIMIGLAVMAVGIGLRGLFGVTGLFLGTLIGGAGIGVIMVVVPGLIKQHFPINAGVMMGLYSTALCVGGAVPAGMAVPLENLPGSNWRWALVFWVLPALLAMAFWRPHIPRNSRPSKEQRAVPKLRRSWLAWQVTLYMGTQSSIAYCLFGWLPLILIDRGMTPLAAGFVLSMTMVIQLLTSMAAAWLATRGKDQRLIIAGLLALTLAGIAGLFYAPLSMVWFFATVMSIGLGGVFAIALALLVLRSPNSQTASALSAMAQGVGYTVAAAGPLLMGLLHEYTGTWNSAFVLFTIMTLAATFFGVGAGRDRYVKPDPGS